jgi:hypothetical protein
MLVVYFDFDGSKDDEIEERRFAQYLERVKRAEVIRAIASDPFVHDQLGCKARWQYSHICLSQPIQLYLAFEDHRRRQNFSQ